MLIFMTEISWVSSLDKFFHVLVADTILGDLFLFILCTDERVPLEYLDLEAVL